MVLLRIYFGRYFCSGLEKFALAMQCYDMATYWYNSVRLAAVNNYTVKPSCSTRKVETSIWQFIRPSSTNGKWHDTGKFPNPAKFVYVRYKYLRIANNSDSIRKMSITVRESDFKFQFIGSRLRSSMNGKVIGKTISLLKL